MDAGPISPFQYEAVLLDYDWRERGQASVVVVDVDTGTHTEVLVEAPKGVDSPRLRCLRMVQFMCCLAFMSLKVSETDH